MRGRRVLSPDELAIARRAYREGHSLRTIGARIGCHREVVRRALVEAGTRIRDGRRRPGQGGGKKPRLSLDQLRAAGRLYHRTELTLAELAARFGLTGSGLNEAFRRLGIPRKKRGWRGGGGTNRAGLKAAQQQADRETRRQTLDHLRELDARRALRLAESPPPFNR